MESPQTYTVTEEPSFPRPHNAPEFPCIICGTKTTFRYESLPLCQNCAKNEKL